jgi:hypothetical protein
MLGVYRTLRLSMFTMRESSSATPSYQALYTPL